MTYEELVQELACNRVCGWLEIDGYEPTCKYRREVVELREEVQVQEREIRRLSMPSCRNCGQRLLRWAWWEQPNEPVKWFYCLECDKAGREPCIQVFDNPDYQPVSPKCWKRRELEANQ